MTSLNTWLNQHKEALYDVYHNVMCFNDSGLFKKFGLFAYEFSDQYCHKEDSSDFQEFTDKIFSQESKNDNRNNQNKEIKEDDLETIISDIKTIREIKGYPGLFTKLTVESLKKFYTDNC